MPPSSPVTSTAGRWRVFQGVHIAARLLLLLNFDVISVLGQHGQLNEATNGSEGTKTGQHEGLFRSLWTDYQTSIRPQCHDSPSGNTQVVLALALRQIQDLDEPRQLLTASVWLRLTWKECRLKWNATHWNVSRLIVPHDRLWTPDLTLLDSPESQLPAMTSHRLSLTSEGSVTQHVPVLARTYCQLDVDRFPYDSQACSLTFSSWVYDVRHLNLTPLDEPVDMTSLVTHSEWEVVRMTVQQTAFSYGGAVFPQVVFTLVFTRLHLFYTITLLLPCILNQLMAGLVFLLPCETKEKVSLQITVLLSLAVMQVGVLDLVPASSHTLPLIAIYFLLAMVMVSVSCVVTVMAQAAHFASRPRRLPSSARALLQLRVAGWLGADTSITQGGILTWGHQKTKRGGNILGTLRGGTKIHATPCHPDFPLKSDVSIPTNNDVELISVLSVSNALPATQRSHRSCCTPDFTQYDATCDVIDHDLTHSDARRSVIAGKRLYEAGSNRKVLFVRPKEFEPPIQAADYYPEQRQYIRNVYELQVVYQKIVDCTRAVTRVQYKQSKAWQSVARREWKELAVLVDKVSLVVFCIFSFGMLLYVFVSAE